MFCKESSGRIMLTVEMQVTVVEVVLCIIFFPQIICEQLVYSSVRGDLDFIQGPFAVIQIQGLIFSLTVTLLWAVIPAVALLMTSLHQCRFN